MTHKCANSECENIIEDDKHKFCSDDCHKRFNELRGVPKNIMVDPIQQDIEKTLNFMGINKSSYGKPYAYNNWYNLIEFIKKNSGLRYNEIVKPRLRSIMGMQHRYIDEYMETLFSWEVILLKEGCIVYKGCPEE